MNNINHKPCSGRMAVLWLTVISVAAATSLSNAQAVPEAGIKTQSPGSDVVKNPVQQYAPKKVQARQRNNAGVTRRAQARSETAGALNCTGETAAPGELKVPLGKSTLIKLPEAVANRTIGNPGVVQAMMVAPRTLYLVGLDVGTTNMIIQGKSGSCAVIDVTVGMDSGALEATLKSLMPNESSNIKVTSAADTLVLSGTVADATAVARAVEIANAFVRRPASPVQSGTPRPITDKADAGENSQQMPLQKTGMQAGGGSKGGQARIVNLLGVADPQQVMLEVKVAEVSKTLLDKLGARSLLQGTSGSWAYTVLAEFLTGTATGIFDATKSNGNSLTLEAEKRDGLVRILAEPTLMAISGQEGKFTAGGTIFIPVSQEFNRIGLEEKDFGVKLSFTPTVLANGRINLKVRPEVSELSREGIGITAVGVSGRAILPLLTKREASTTVQLNDGQSFAIGGLIKNNSTANIKALPVLGEIPVLGALFRSTDFQEDRTELLFVVTPRLVKPLPANYSLPTDNVVPAGRAELFLGGRLESSNPNPHTNVAPAAPAADPETSSRRGPSGFDVR